MENTYQLKPLHFIKQHPSVYHPLGYYSGGRFILGAPPDLHGDYSGLYGICKLTGDATGLYGWCEYVWGDATHVTGNCSGLHGNLTGVSGNLDNITREMRVKCNDVDHWIGVSLYPSERSEDSPVGQESLDHFDHDTSPSRSLCFSNEAGKTLFFITLGMLLGLALGLYMPL